MQRGRQTNDEEPAPVPPDRRPVKPVEEPPPERRHDVPDPPMEEPDRDRIKKIAAA